MFAWLRRWWPARPTRLGDRGEVAAEQYLRKLGYRIRARHLRTKLGEFDLIAEDGRSMVFVEVKTRAGVDHGHPAEFVNLDKQRRMTRAAVGYLKRYRRLDRPSRFDVIAITWPADGRPHIEHIKHAFEAVGFDGLYS